MAQKEKQQKGVWPTCASGGDGGGNPLSVYVFFLALLLLSLTHTAHGSIECKVTKDKKGMTQPQTSVKSAVKSVASVTVRNQFCFVLYNLDGQDNKTETRWSLIHYTYLAGGSTKNYDINVCQNSTSIGRCQVAKTYSTISGSLAWRLDFVCCCDTPTVPGTECNQAMANANMNPQLQFKKQLEHSKHQICNIDYDQNKRIDDCSRLSEKKETDAPSSCRSLLEGNEWVLGCALDNGGTDRCSWAAKLPEVKSGACRLDANNNVECCCLGKYCNGEPYMNLECRAKTKQWSTHWNFTYGVPGCGVAWPKKTTPIPTSAGQDTTTTTGGSSSTLLIVGVIVGVIVLLLICIVVAVGIFVYCKKKRRKGKEGQGVADPNNTNDQKGAAGVDQKDAGAVEQNDAVVVDAVDQGPASTDPNLGGSDADMKNQ